MKILLTGASGFLGRYILESLNIEGYEVDTIGRNPLNDIRFDLSSGSPNLNKDYELIIHCAGMAHIRLKNSDDSEKLYKVNVDATKYLLNSLKDKTSPKYFVYISSVAVYGMEKGLLIDEDSPKLAKDPYGLSKIMSEQIIAEWCKERNIQSLILRLPLVVGKNPPGNLAAMIRAIKGNYFFNISNGEARKSMVLASDVASIIPKAFNIGGIYNLTDGYHPSFHELSNKIASELNKSSVPNMNYKIARIIATFGDYSLNVLPLNSDKLLKITSSLTFDDSRARKQIDWKPYRVLDKFVL